MNKKTSWGMWHASGRFKYDSKWEQHITKNVLPDWEYHPQEKIKYSVDHTYSTDWKVFIKDTTYLVEGKGYFKDRSEATKYIWIRNSLPKDYELVFLFQKPGTPMPGAKKRKDGTKQSMREWAEKNNFRWFTEEDIRRLEDD